LYGLLLLRLLCALVDVWLLTLTRLKTELLRLLLLHVGIVLLLHVRVVALLLHLLLLLFLLVVLAGSVSLIMGVES
jgi:hypothetical protein